jgi:TetR/AcrR family transcriptional repressor of nem operon
MKVTKEKVAQNRAALVQAAGRLFRERGIDGVGVAEICKAAGLTHGALYAQFSSKEALAAEALAYGLDRSRARMTAATDNRKPRLTDFLDYYMARSRRDNIGGSCPMTASASEIARQDAAVSARFGEGFERTVETVQAALGATASSATARQRALAIVAAMIGGIAVSRAVRKARPRLSDDILRAVRHAAGEVGGEAATRKGKARARKR